MQGHLKPNPNRKTGVHNASLQPSYLIRAANGTEVDASTTVPGGIENQFCPVSAVH